MATVTKQLPTATHLQAWLRGKPQSMILGDGEGILHTWLESRNLTDREIQEFYESEAGRWTDDYVVRTREEFGESYSIQVWQAACCLTDAGPWVRAALEGRSI